MRFLRAAAFRWAALAALVPLVLAVVGVLVVSGRLEARLTEAENPVSHAKLMIAITVVTDCISFPCGNHLSG